MSKPIKFITGIFFVGFCVVYTLILLALAVPPTSIIYCGLESVKSEFCIVVDSHN